MDATFERAMDFVFQWEGGLCDDANDHGGITKYGIVLDDLQKYNPKATREDIINLTKAQAKEIYYKDYWLKTHCDQIQSEDLAIAFFDTCVNCGPRQATLFLQRAVNNIGNDHIKVDGKVGNITIGAVNSHSASGILENFIIQRMQFYKDLAKNVPGQHVFLRGWLNRSNALAKAVDCPINSSMV